jgi:hypothetical protein
MLSKMSSDSGSFEIERRGLARELGAVAFRGPVGRSDVAVSPDGTTIAVASARRVLELDSKPPVAARQIRCALRRRAFSTGIQPVFERSPCRACVSLRSSVRF